MTTKIAVFGAIGVDDVGDVVMMESILNKIVDILGKNNKKAKFYIFSLDVDKAKEQLSSIDFDFLILESMKINSENEQLLNSSFENLLKNDINYYKNIDSNFIKNFSECDKIVFIGGGYFNKFWGVKLIPKFFIPLALCNILNKDAFISGVTIGPFDDLHTKKFYGCFKCVKHLILRDGSRSLCCLKKLGSTDGKIHCSGDDVLDRWFDSDESISESVRLKEEKFAIFHLHHWAEMYSSNYIKLYKELSLFLHFLISSGGLDKVYFLPFDYFKGLDYECGRRLSTFFENRPEYVVIEPTNDHIFMRKLISKSVFVLSSRYHPIIFSLGENVPAIGLYVNDLYEKKIGGAFQSIGILPSAHSLFIDDVTSDKLCSWYKKYVQNGGFPLIDKNQIKLNSQVWDQAAKSFFA